MGFAQIVASGDRRKSLEATRDLLAGTLEICEPKEVASLTRQLVAVLGELEAFPDAKVVSPVDDLGARRNARRKAAAGS